MALVLRIIDHTAHIPNLMPSNFQLFRPSVKHLAGKQFIAVTNVKQVVTWPQTIDINFFYAGKKTLVLQWQKHLNVIAVKVEVWCVLSTIHCNIYIKIFVLLLEIPFYYSSCIPSQLLMSNVQQAIQILHPAL